MKFILLFLFSLTLMAQESKTCYSVEIEKEDYTKKNITTIHNNKYPESCLRMKIGSSIAVRCGCYEYKDEADESVLFLKKTYKKAKSTLTYKHRFTDKPKKLLIPKEQKPSCYSTEIYNQPYTQKNINALTKITFPKECKTLKIAGNLSVRCGCYQDKEVFKKDFLSLRKTYPNAKTTLTYTHRFQEKPKKIAPAKKKKALIDNSTCYSVELLKRKNNRESINELSKQTFPESCVLMNINDLVAMRCGCFDTKKEVIEHYRPLKEKYKNASIRKSFKRKFIKNKAI